MIVRDLQLGKNPAIVFQDLMEEFTTYLNQGHANTTVKAYRGKLNLIIPRYLRHSGSGLQDLLTLRGLLALVEFISSACRSENLAAKTTQGYFSALKILMKFLARKDIIATDCGDRTASII